MSLESFRKSVSAKISGALNAVHGTLFAAADLSDAAVKYQHALNGEEYHADLGVYGHFDPHSTEGQQHVEKARMGLLSARLAYINTHGDDPQMRSADDALFEDYGINTQSLITPETPGTPDTPARDDAGEHGLFL